MTRARRDCILSLDKVGVQLFRRRGVFGRKTVRHWALREVTFDLYPGEVLGIIGKNGSGKSTLLRTLAHIIEPDRGRIRRFGKKACLLSLRAGFINELTGRENAMMSGQLLGISGRRMKALIDEIAQFSELGKWFDEPISTYSSGMRSRLGFSTAIHIDADIILIDEALSVGDESFRQKSSAKMQEIIQSSARTVVLVSNSAATIEKNATRALWLNDGRIAMSGNPSEVTAAYLDFMKVKKARNADGAIAEDGDDASADLAA